MFSDYVFLAAFLIGIISGLRSLTAPAVVAWSVQFHWISLRGTLLAFLGSWPAVGVFTFFAITEYLADKLPRTPPRAAPAFPARSFYFAVLEDMVAILGALAIIELLRPV